MLYECDLCYLVQDFYSLSKLLGGGARAPLPPPPLVSATESKLSGIRQNKTIK